MPATLIKLGSPDPTFGGGDAELEVVSRLVEKLSERYVIVSICHSQRVRVILPQMQHHHRDSGTLRSP